MTKKSIQLNTKSVQHGTKMNTIVIPELEPYRIAGKTIKGSGTEWTPEELAIMQKYYGYCHVKILLKYLPGRNHTQVLSKASRLGLSNRERE
jgi:hypothetical protein